jgi:hypothetical protein
MGSTSDIGGHLLTASGLKDSSLAAVEVAVDLGGAGAHLALAPDAYVGNARFDRAADGSGGETSTLLTFAHFRPSSLMSTH